MKASASAWSAAALLAFLLIAGCGDPQPAVQRTISAEDLSLQDVRERAIAAITDKGVIHATATSEHSASGFVVETWVDLEAETARVEQNGVVSRIMTAGMLAELHDRRYVEVPYSDDTSTIVPLISFTLPHLGLLHRDDAEDISIDNAVILEHAAIRVRFKQEYGGDATGKETVSIYLDEQFLPLRIERRGPGARSSNATHEISFVSPDDLPVDYFSFDAVKALARTPADDLADVAASGRQVYWLGSTFEGIILRDESRVATLPGDPDIVLSYGPADFFTPSPCVRIQYENADRWADILAAGANKGLTEVERVDAGPGEFIVYAGAAAPPAAVTIIPQPGQPVPTPPDLPDAPEDTGIYYEALATLEDGTGIVVSPSCGPVGTNKYRSLDGLRLVLRSLRLFEPPSQPPASDADPSP